MLKRKVGETSPETHYQNQKAICTMGVGEMSVEDLEQMFDRKIVHLATKNDLMELHNHIKEQKDQIDKLQDQLVQTNSKLQQTQDALQKTQQRCMTWEREVQIMAKRACENNVIVHIPTTSNIDPIIRAKEICSDLMEVNINENKFIDVKKLGSSNKSVANVLVKLINTEDTRKLITKSVRLRNSGISIHRDFPKVVRDRRRRIFNLKRDILSKNKYIKVFLRGEHIQVEDKVFFFDENDKLVLKDGDGDGAEVLNQLVMTVSNSSTNNLTTATTSSFSTTNHTHSYTRTQTSNRS